MSNKEQSDGSSANYYKLPENASELQDLISAKNMNFYIGSIFELCYDHSKAEKAQDKNSQICIIARIINYAEYEKKRIETMYKM